MRDISEAQFQKQVMDLCVYLGALAYHTHDARRSNPGYPDVTLLTKGGRLLFRELKTRTGRVRPEQKVWIDRLRAAGYDAGIWRPEDMDRIHAELAL